MFGNPRSLRCSTIVRSLCYREICALQYVVRDRLTALGWSRVETVALGRSAAGVTHVDGFDRMVAEVCLGKTVRS